jgi:hypothetical protein
MPPPSDLLTLADPGLITTPQGHAYVLSRWPDKIELAEMWDAMEPHKERMAGQTGEVLHMGDDQIIVRGLSTGARPLIESAIFAALMAAAAAHADASAGGGHWVEERLADRGEAEAIIRESLDRLPVDLP